MEKFIKYSDSKEPEETQFEYEIGEVITVNSVDKFKCVKKVIVSNQLIQFFKKGIITYEY